MPTRLDIKLRPKVVAVLEKYGGPAVVDLVDNTYDIDSGGNDEASVSVGVKASPPSPFDDSWQSSLTWTLLDLYTIVPAIPLESNPRAPRKGDRIRFTALGSKTYSVVEVETFMSGEQACAYALKLQRM